jgi:hypothetical protein
MNVEPTLEGGLRIDADEPSDWEILRAIIIDATTRTNDLADQLGALISEEAGAEDWREYIVPDLRETFQDALNHVATAIEAAAFHAANGPGSLWIRREDGYPWYSALNQAALALERSYAFSSKEDFPLLNYSPHQLSAYARSICYADIQELLLDYVLD